ncbi:MAG: TIGR03621 family F420-dependent LLM class oxidoreductase [Candidatus Thorarchaeota archaeon]|jgi:probable F420-dependent oxidoreductase
MKPFRFGVFPHVGYWEFPFSEWSSMARQLEELGYSTIFQCDHFQKLRHDPFVMLASAASVTKRLNIGTFVLDVDYRHPVILAKAAATLHLLSDGRFEFGIGAGWDKRDYDMAGIRYDPPSKRVSRLEEAVQIIMSMWTQEKTSFSGKHYHITDMWKAGNLPDGERPKLFIGGGGKRMLSIAGKYADIVGINFNLKDYGKLPHEVVFGRAFKGQTLGEVKRKVELVKKVTEASNRNPEEIEFQMGIIETEISDEPEPLIEKFADDWNITVKDVTNSAPILIGSSSDIVERLKRIREYTGVNYFVLYLRQDQVEEYAESIVQPLTI